MSFGIRAESLALKRGGRNIVAGIGFAAGAGERIALLGANGSGKTTLARALLGFADYEGRLEVEGREVRDDPRAARRAVAAVFSDADPQLLMPTVHDELAFSLQAAGMESGPARVGELAARFGLTGLLGRHPSRLSSGEKRKALLALSIGRRPSILVLDEPTADLDARGTRGLTEALISLPQTIILATHDYDLARAVCRKAVVLGGGRSAFYDEIESLFADHRRLEEWELV